MIETEAPPERAVLVGVQLSDTPPWEMEYSLDELASLADTAGIEILDKCGQSRRQVHPATFIGSGKVAEIRELAVGLGADVVIFDTELTPAQIKNLEQAMQIRVMDRSDVILTIFSERAQTREAKLQVDLARMKYFLPRLKSHWTHLERQIGGVGVRGGMGEKQIEIDRRLVRKRIDKYEEDLKTIEKQRTLRNRNRQEGFTVALIGYTNVGKSTLFNRLTQANVLVEDRLFATLDSTVRKVDFGTDHAFLLTDTVGFVRKLPHHLVASFRSTLAEAVNVELLLHVVDVSSPYLAEQIKAVDEVLTQLEITDKPTIYVLNKIDQASDEDRQNIWKHIPKDAPYIAVSAQTGENIDLLQALIVETFAHKFKEETFVIPLSEPKWVAKLYELGTLLSEEYLESNQIKVRVYGAIAKVDQFKKAWNEHKGVRSNSA